MTFSILVFIFLCLEKKKQTTKPASGMNNRQTLLNNINLCWLLYKAAALHIVIKKKEKSIPPPWANDDGSLLSNQMTQVLLGSHKEHWRLCRG